MLTSEIVLFVLDNLVSSLAVTWTEVELDAVISKKLSPDIVLKFDCVFADCEFK